MRKFVTKENLSETVSSLNSLTKAVVSLDSETTGLRWPDPMFSLQLAVQFGDSYYFNFNNFSEPEKALNRSVLHALQPLWRNPEIRWVIANAKFDLRRLEIDDIYLNGEIYDVLLMAKIQYNRHMSYSLDSCLKRINLGKNDLVSLYIKDHKLHTSYNVPGKKLKEKDLHYDRVPLDLMVEYGFDDVEANLKLYEHQTEYFEKLENREQIDLVHSNLELVKTVYNMESKGICIDVDYCQGMVDKCEGKLQQITKEIEDIVGRPYKAGPIWLTQALKEQGITVNVSAKGNSELGSSELESMNNALASLVSNLRETEKEAGFYYTLLRFNVDGIIHTNYRLNGTDTLRFSSNDPNLQNIPACKKGEVETVRHAFRPRPGFKFVSIDYSSMEYRLCVDIAGQLDMIEAIKNGLDPHQMVADLMGSDRKAAKTINFLSLYGGGSGKLAGELGCDLNTAKGLMSKYYQALPRVKQLHSEVQGVAVSRGYVRNAFGMRYYLDDPNFAYRMVNHLIQGTGACIIRSAMNKIAYLLGGMKSKMILQIHDEILLEVHESEIHIIPEIKRTMEDSYIPVNGMRMACDVAISETSWNENNFYKWEITNDIQNRGPSTREDGQATIPGGLYAYVEDAGRMGTQTA